MVFSLRQLQEKCVEQQRPLYVVFIDLTKAFDSVSRSGLFSILKRLGCPDTLLSILMGFHDDMQVTVQFNGSKSEKFPIHCGVKQGCVLAPTLFGILFLALLHRAFPDLSGILLHTRSSGKLFNLSLQPVRRVLIRELLYADDAAIVAHSETELQSLCSSFAKACSEFGLKISLGKTVLQLLQPSPSTGQLWAWLISFHTLALPSPTLTPLMLNSTPALARPQPHLADFANVFGETETSPSNWRSAFAWPVC